MKRFLQKIGFLWMLALMSYAATAQTVIYDNGTPKRPTAVNGLVVNGVAYNATFTYNLPIDGTRLSTGIDLTEASVRPFRDSLRNLFNRQATESNLTFIAIVIGDNGSNVQLCYTADGGEGINDWFTDCLLPGGLPDFEVASDHAIADFELATNCTISAIAINNLSDCQEGATASTFTSDVTVTFADAPTSGTLNLMGDGSASVAVAMLDSETSHTFEGVRMLADGEAIDLTATFSADESCTFNNATVATAPADCSCENIASTLVLDEIEGVIGVWGDGMGHLYMASWDSTFIIKLNLNDNTTTEIETGAPFKGVIWGDGLGNLFFPTWVDSPNYDGPSSIIKLNLNDNTTTEIAIGTGSFIAGVWGDSSGNLFVSETRFLAILGEEDNKILKIDLNNDNAITVVLDSLVFPEAIWGDDSGHLFFTHIRDIFTLNSDIVQLNLNDGDTTEIINSDKHISELIGDGLGNLLAIQSTEGIVSKIDLNNNNALTEIIADLQWPSHPFADGLGNLYIPELAGKKVSKIECASCLINAGSDTTVCNNNYTLQGTALQTGETGQWTFVSNPDNKGTLTNPTSPNAIVNANFDAVGIFETNDNVARTFTLRWTATGGSCGAGMSDEVTIILNPPVNAGIDRLNICGTTVSLGATPASDGTGSWTFISNPNNSGSIDDLSKPNATLTGVIGGSYELEWMVTGGACNGSMDRVKLAFQPDSDNDTFQDCVDLCEGGDDRINTDNMGIPDDCDCSPNSADNELVTLDVTSYTAFINEQVSQDTARRIADFQLTSTAVIESTHPVVVFQAGNNIILEVGFHAKAGSNFIAEIGYCKDPAANNFSTEQAASSRTQQTNVEQITDQLSMFVFPNPIKQEAAINLVLPTEMPVDLMLFNQNGQLVRHYLHSKTEAKGAHYYKLDASNLSSGLYFLQLRSQEGVITQKLVVQK